ncbi:hypothetical protein CRUP_037641 [Coryphaenoides rupestris]|nr:hypothetical protein CRUP_037641 [Coryphaenoides rupestris]
MAATLHMSRLAVQKANRSQVHLEDGRVRINCSVTSQTSADSQHAVLWYVRRAAASVAAAASEAAIGTAGGEADELLLHVDRSGELEYGAYAAEEHLRRRVQAERLSPRLNVLTLNRAEAGDSGAYYCLVEEWLSDPDGTWYQLASDASGFTRVSVRRPGCTVNTPTPTDPPPPPPPPHPGVFRGVGPTGEPKVEEAESNITVAQGDSIRLGCSIPSQSSRDSRFSVSWYKERSFAYGPEDGDDDEDADTDELDDASEVAAVGAGGANNGGSQCVFSIGHDGIFGNGNCSPPAEEEVGVAAGVGPNSRLQFAQAWSDQYSLTVQRARPSDAGRYFCHVEEWLLNTRNAWYRLATNNSGYTVVNVLERVSTLRSAVCANDSLFYFIFFYPFPIFGTLLIALLLVRYKGRGHGKSQEGKNGAPLLWIKEPHLSYSPTCLDPPTLSLHPGSVD